MSQSSLFMNIAIAGPDEESSRTWSQEKKTFQTTKSCLLYAGTEGMEQSAYLASRGDVRGGDTENAGVFDLPPNQ
jgi:hypothetical protein